MKKFGLATLIAGGLTAAVLGFAGPAQADIVTNPVTPHYHVDKHHQRLYRRTLLITPLVRTPRARDIESGVTQLSCKTCAPPPAGGAQPSIRLSRRRS
jgi:hypothetical protein